jgi:uncharacterized protein (TIGR02246 family)
MNTDGTPSTFVGPSPADQAAVWSVSQRIVAAWADNDADAFAAVFAADGTLILPGVYHQGRGAIRQYMASAFAGALRGTRVTGQPIFVRFLGTDAMLLITAGGVLAPGESQVSDANAIRASWLISKQSDGQWLLSAYQNSQRDK